MGGLCAYVANGQPQEKFDPLLDVLSYRELWELYIHAIRAMGRTRMSWESPHRPPPPLRPALQTLHRRPMRR